LYKLEYLPAARKDIVEIAQYVSRELNNHAAAERLVVELVEAGDKITHFPYANPAYVPIRPLRREYRKLLVRSYLMLYWIDEEKKLVTVARVIYARRDYGRLLD